mmetsp:Transcript_3018/g.3320  ORF Transcript_3018/g.3320 Transcript_3018/m.3320 type:complete len:428 (+) Transcript_3018:162-1445(+)
MLILAPFLFLLPSSNAFTSPRQRQACSTLYKPSFGIPKQTNNDKRPFTHLSAESASTVSEFASDLLPGINVIDEMNPTLVSQLCDLRHETYFRLYSVDMMGSCEYIPQELFECYSESCEIYPIDDDEIPDTIREIDSQEHNFELDGWARWDMPSEDYYDTDQFPEEYTGYDGSDVWKFIHERICFKEFGDDAEDDSWRVDFNKAVSGLHSMISAQVIRGIGKKVAGGETIEEEWNDPAVEYERRLSPTGENPKALENLYFGYMLVLSAVAKARERLLSECESAGGSIDAAAAAKLLEILNHPLLDEPTHDVASQKLHDHALLATSGTSASTESNNAPLWNARMRTRELMRIMNCVQCNKCRFHGKIAVLGLSTAFQILLGRTGDGADGGDLLVMHRVELAALMTTMSKYSTASQLCSQKTAEMGSCC